MAKASISTETASRSASTVGVPICRDPYAAAGVDARHDQARVRILEARTRDRLEALNPSGGFCRSDERSRSGNGSQRTTAVRIRTIERARERTIEGRL